MKNPLDDWEKPRGKRDYFTAEEIALVATRHAEGVPARAVARELKCATRTINRRFRELDSGSPEQRREERKLARQRHWEAKRKLKLKTPKAPAVAKRKRGRPPRTESEVVTAPPKQTEAERRASRFYHSNFEL